MLPGLEDTGERPGSSARSDSRTESKSRAAAGAARRPQVSAVRMILGGMAVALGLALALYGFHRLELFLIVDPRFALNGEDPSDDSAAVEVAGATHASRRAIEGVFA